MSLIALAITLGSPNSVGEVPITTSNLASSIAQAVVDLAVITAARAVVVADATSADNDVALAITANNNTSTANGTATTDANTADANVATVQTNEATAFTDYNTFAAALIAITGDTYNTTTHQFTTGGATGLTHAQWVTLAALLNTSLADFNTAKTSTDTAKTATALVKTDIAAVAVDIGLTATALTTSKTATALTKTDATALSTAAVAADLAAAQTLIASANVLVQTDGSVVTNVALLNGALVAALTFTRDTAILPT